MNREAHRHLLELREPRERHTEGRTPVSGDHALHDSTRVNALKSTSIQTEVG